MAATVKGLTDLSADILLAVFEQLVGDYTTLRSIALTCRVWRALSLPVLLEHVDLSSHNNGEMPEHADEKFCPVVFAEYSGDYRPENLVTRQRRFLRLMTAQPELSGYVKALVWTMVWCDPEDEGLANIDRQTWAVFSRLTNVTRLDLASLHELVDIPYIREHPVALFPAVIHLRLLGVMSRSLVKAIVSSPEARKLRSLSLDFLHDEGLLPGFGPFPVDLAMDVLKGRDSDDKTYINDDLFERQEVGSAATFPGPMWFPLRLLRVSGLDSLTHLQVKLESFNAAIDIRNYYTLFRETAGVIRAARRSLRCLVLAFEEHRMLHSMPDSICHTARSRLRGPYKLNAMTLAADFMDQLIWDLRYGDYPHLTSIQVLGFHVPSLAALQHPLPRSTAEKLEALQQFMACGDPRIEFKPAIDYRMSGFNGHDYARIHQEDYQWILNRS